jgi:hypothetical protein
MLSVVDTANKHKLSPLTVINNIVSAVMKTHSYMDVFKLGWVRTVEYKLT